MPLRTGTDLRARSEDGFSLVELLVAATILVIAVVGIFTALEAVGRAGADERNRAIAYQLAQEDQVRLRGLKVTALLGPSQNGLNSTRTTTIDGTVYTVKSTSRITADATGTEACDAGSASADYLSIGSTVTWPTMDVKPVTIQSIVTPASGSFDPDTGALAISVVNGQGQGVPNVPLSGTGAGSFSGMTGDAGCVIFANLPRGNYNVTPTASGLVDQDGNAAGPQVASVLAGATNTKVFQLDRPGSITVNFQTKRTTTASPTASAMDQVQVFNTGMTTGKTFGTLNSRVSQITAGSLFPFSSPDTVYAGSCPGNTPTATTPLSALGTAQVNAGGPASAVTLTLPAMDITVRTGTSSTSSGSLMSNAKVVISDDNCPGVKRTLFTNTSGKLADPGLPWSTYDICVSGNVSGTNRLVTRTNIDVKNPNTPTVVPTIYLGAGSTTTSTGCT